jgi:hypothetical protein
MRLKTTRASSLATRTHVRLMQPAPRRSLDVVSHVQSSPTRASARVHITTAQSQSCSRVRTKTHVRHKNCDRQKASKLRPKRVRAPQTSGEWRAFLSVSVFDPQALVAPATRDNSRPRCLVGNAGPAKPLAYGSSRGPQHLVITSVADSAIPRLPRESVQSCRKNVHHLVDLSARHAQ